MLKNGKRFQKISSSRPDCDGLGRRRSEHIQGRFRGGGRPQRERQKHAAADAGRHAIAQFGPRAAGRTVDLRLEIGPSRQVEKKENRFCLPDVQSRNLSIGSGKRADSPISCRAGRTRPKKNGHIALLDRVGLADRLHHKPCELSVGQQQRVALARMLANDPAVILADEPTGNLDPETTQHVIKFLEDVNQEGRTIVMVTHDPRAAEKAKNTLRLTNGAILSNNQDWEELHVA